MFIHKKNGKKFLVKAESLKRFYNLDRMLHILIPYIDLSNHF